MSFTTEQVRAQLATMGYRDVPDAAVALFAAKLTEKARERLRATAETADEMADGNSRIDDSSSDDEEDYPNSQQSQRMDRHTARYADRSGQAVPPAARPPLPPSNRCLLLQRSRPRAPLTALQHSASPRLPPRPTLARSAAPSTPRSHRAEEQREADEGDDYDSNSMDGAGQGGGRSEKENVATLINIQRGLAKVLAERGIASPYKLTPPPSAASDRRAPTSRPSSPLSVSSASSLLSDLSFSTMSSVGTAPLLGPRALQQREEERVRGVRRGYGQGGFKKADVVNRYQQYKAEWEQSSFLHRTQQGK